MALSVRAEVHDTGNTYTVRKVQLFVAFHSQLPLYMDGRANQVDPIDKGVCEKEVQPVKCSQRDACLRRVRDRN